VIGVVERSRPVARDIWYHMSNRIEYALALGDWFRDLMILTGL
jgi:hypothetical protein